MFVKLFSQILDSSIADDRKLRHFFTDFLLCADMRGYVIMTESAIARRIGSSLEEVLWGISELEKPDTRSKSPDNDGARIEKLEGMGYGWRIINYETYRSLKSAEEMREKTKERVRRHREKKQAVTECNAGNTIQRENQKADTEAEAIKPIVPSGTVDAPYSEFIESLWKVFPKEGKSRSSKAKASAQWKKTTKKPDESRILQSIDEWKLTSIWNKGFVPGLHTWIKDRKWENEPEPSASTLDKQTLFDDSYEKFDS